MENNLIILGIIFYLIGSIPFAYILPKILGFGDLRNIGSGNIGATNVLRTGNKTLTFVVLLFDILKGFLPFLILKEYIISSHSEKVIYLLASLAIFGHIFPIWLKFKGGKGVATYIGYLFAANYFLGFVFIFFWLIIAIIKKYSSLASIFSLIVLPFTAIFLTTDNNIVIILFVLSFVIILKHYSNILRLLNKTENKISF